MKKTLFIVLIFAFLGLSENLKAENQIFNLHDEYILTFSGEELLALDLKNKEFYTVKNNISNISISTNGFLVYKTISGDIFYSQLLLKKNKRLFTQDIFKINDFNSMDQFNISHNGQFIITYRQNKIKLFEIIDTNVIKKFELKIDENSQMISPVFSHTNSHVAFYNFSKNTYSYELALLEINKKNYINLTKQKFVFITLSSIIPIIEKPYWNSTGEYIIFTGKNSITENNNFNIIRLKDKKTLPTSSSVWADKQSICYLNYNHDKLIYRAENVTSLFDYKDNSTTKSITVDVPFKRVLDIKSFDNNKIHIIQDFDYNFYLYDSKCNILKKICTLKKYSNTFFIVKQIDKF